MNRSIPLDRYPAGNPLALDYLKGSAGVMPWYHHDTSKPDWDSNRIAELQGRSFPDRARLAQSIAGRMSAWGADELALQAAASLADDNTYVITTGQQAGLFGGPLYTPLKAMAVILHARRLSERFPQLRFVPVFGIAAIDSDFEEIRSSSLFNRSWELDTLSLEPQPDEDNRIIPARDLSGELPALLDSLQSVLPDSEFGNRTVQAMRESYSDGSLVNGFARWMLKVFAGTGLVLLDSSDPQYLRCSADLLEHQLSQASEAAALLAGRNSRIREAGYSLQVESQPADLQLFWLDDEKCRHKIIVQDGRPVLRDKPDGPDSDELLRQARETPERFVPGALLGPLWQDRMLPNVAWVGGMAELAYRAQSSALFEFHGIRMAPSFLRCTATLLSAKHEQQLDEFGWELTELYRPVEELEAMAVEKLRPRGLDEAVATYLETLEKADSALLELALQVDPSLDQSFATIRGNILKTADKLEKKITSSLKRHNETITRRAASLHGLANPGNVPQERVVSYASMLARYGESLTGRLMAQLDPLAAAHRVLIMD
ncbi:MAG: bacillithiol biosynthesis cysteine-adding enzyme BshC [Planctomycetales bacterium]|nr:bacillithiol biosynthesis cysteine-adding enzyme BshC [bacterium]UNM06881.1 MAG: bacillithiol biosynthesis cysteine-adding enzyme BshC [Planctomycetales bacterium]